MNIFVLLDRRKGVDDEPSNRITGGESQIVVSRNPFKLKPAGRSPSPSWSTTAAEPGGPAPCTWCPAHLVSGPLPALVRLHSGPGTRPGSAEEPGQPTAGYPTGDPAAGAGDQSRVSAAGDCDGPKLFPRLWVPGPGANKPAAEQPLQGDKPM